MRAKRLFPPSCESLPDSRRRQHAQAGRIRALPARPGGCRAQGRSGAAPGWSHPDRSGEGNGSWGERAHAEALRQRQADRAREDHPGESKGKTSHRRRGPRSGQARCATREAVRSSGYPQARRLAGSGRNDHGDGAPTGSRRRGVQAHLDPERRQALGASATAPRDPCAPAGGSAAVDSAGKTACGGRTAPTRSPGHATFGSSLETRTSAEAAPAAARPPQPPAFDDEEDIPLDVDEVVEEPTAPAPTPLRPVPSAAHKPALSVVPPPGDGGEALLRDALSKASREVIEKIAWEVVPELAETIIREELERLIKERGA